MHFDKGILNSLKQLFTRLGNSIKEFIEGKRVNHFRSLSLVVVLTTFYVVLYHYFNDGLNYSEFNNWMLTHFSWITIATIPFIAIGPYICFRKQGYNFIEYFVLNTFKSFSKAFFASVTISFTAVL